jgi:hypothetical protein
MCPSGPDSCNETNAVSVLESYLALVVRFVELAASLRRGEVGDVVAAALMALLLFGSSSSSSECMYTVGGSMRGHTRSAIFLKTAMEYRHVHETERSEQNQ